MKKIGLLLLLSIFVVAPSCTTVKLKRGANKDCNCFYSSKQPNIKITFADNYHFFEKQKNSYLWADENYYMGIQINYERNKSIENTVDYYYPIEKVLQNWLGSRNMNIGYGKEDILGHTFYYSDFIDHRSDDQIYIVRVMVLPSNNRDWVIISMYHQFSHEDFKSKYSTGTDYFQKNPSVEKQFYEAIQKAIIQIEPFHVEPEGSVQTDVSQLKKELIGEWKYTGIKLGGMVNMNFTESVGSLSRYPVISFHETGKLDVLTFQKESILKDTLGEDFSVKGANYEIRSTPNTPLLVFSMTISPQKTIKTTRELKLTPSGQQLVLTAPKTYINGQLIDTDQYREDVEYIYNKL